MICIPSDNGRHHVTETFTIWSVYLLIMVDTVLLRLSLHFTTHYYALLHFTTLHYTSLHFTTHHYALLRFTTLHYTSLHYTSPHFTTLRHTLLPFTTLYHTSLNFNTLHLYFLLYVFNEMLSWYRRSTFIVDPIVRDSDVRETAVCDQTNHEHRVLCCVLILKQLDSFYRVISSPLSRPPIWVMCLRTSEGPGASSADGHVMRTAVRVPDRERCALPRVRVWTCSTALGSWLKGYTTRRGYVESDGTSTRGIGWANCSYQPTANGRTTPRHLRQTLGLHCALQGVRLLSVPLGPGTHYPHVTWAHVHCRDFACCQCHLGLGHTILTSRELMCTAESSLAVSATWAWYTLSSRHVSSCDVTRAAGKWETI
jgi:hypothetical protein